MPAARTHRYTLLYARPTAGYRDTDCDPHSIHGPKSPPTTHDNTIVTSLACPNSAAISAVVPVPAVTVVRARANRPSRAARAIPTGLPVIRTRRLVLRCLAESDLGEFTRVMDLSREHLHRWIPIVAPQESNTQAMKRCISLAANGDQTRSAWRRVACTPSGRLVGGFSIFAITRGLTSEGCAHWWVAADAIGRGYGREIVAAAVAHATRDLPSGLGLHAVHAAIHPDNAVSAALARRVGFVHTGVCQPVRVGDRWERHDQYVFRVRADAIDGADYGSNSTTSADVGGSAGISSIPGIGSGVPSLATRS